MTTPLFADGSVIDSTGARVPLMLPIGITAHENPTHVVSIELSTGATVVVGTVSELLRLLREMINEGVYYIFPTEDLFILRAGAAKLLICESTFQNQKLLNTAAPTYSRGRLEFLMRCSARAVDLDAALASVGHYRQAQSPYMSNVDLQAPVGIYKPRIVVVDYKYSQTTALPTFGAQLVDNPPHQFAAT